VLPGECAHRPSPADDDSLHRSAAAAAACIVLLLLLPLLLLIAGMLPYQEIAASAPFAAAFNARGAPWMAIIVGFGSVCGILDTIVVTQYSMSRTFVILGRMGLVPPVLVRGVGEKAKQ
jgi:APA family basic amino acid/polyamine antiporter